MKNCVLIGFGEIGQAVYNAYSDFHNIDVVDLNDENVQLTDHEVMLVAIPYSDNFVEIVSKYQQRFNTKSKIIFSTVEIGTTSKLKNAVHVPIEGKHPNLTESLKAWQVFMGGYNQVAYDFFVQSGKLPYVLEKSEHTEFLKLQSTTNYGLMIEYARYCDGVCKDIGMDYGKINDYNQAYNVLYQGLGMSQYSRYILTPPDGPKKGHCVTPNSNILRKQYPSVLVDIVAEVQNND